MQTNDINVILYIMLLQFEINNFNFKYLYAHSDVKCMEFDLFHMNYSDYYKILLEYKIISYRIAYYYLNI